MVAQERRRWSGGFARRLFSASGGGEQDKAQEQEEESEERKLLRQKIEAGKLLKQRKEEETARFNKEREEYEEKVRLLRKQWILELNRKHEEEDEDRQRRIAAGRAKVKKEHEQMLLLEEERLKNRTKLEVTPEEHFQALMRQIADERRKTKLIKRQMVLEKLQAQQNAKQQDEEAKVKALAAEAEGWITKQDVEAGKHDEILRQKLIQVQPLTAAFVGALPTRHHDDAKMFLTPENDAVTFDEEFWKVMEDRALEFLNTLPQDMFNDLEE